MSSYCDICRKLDVPYHHHHDDDEENVTGSTTSRRPSPPVTGAGVSTEMGRYPSRDRDTVARAGSAGGKIKRSPQYRGRQDGHFMSSPASRRVSPAVGVERGTVSSLLRQVGTPHCSPCRSEPGAGARGHRMERFAESGRQRGEPSQTHAARTPQDHTAVEGRQKKWWNETNATCSRSALLREDLRGMLERIREAVRKDRNSGSALVPDNGVCSELSRCGESSLTEVCPGEGSSKGKGFPVQSTTVGLAAAEGAGGGRPNPGGRGCNSSSCDTAPSSVRDRSPLTLYSQSNLCGTETVPPTLFNNVADHTRNREKPVGDRDNSTGDNPSINTDVSNCNSSSSVLGHIEMLRSGFSELCAAVREDLHALHARVDGIQRQQRRQQAVLDSLNQQQLHRVHGNDDGGEVLLPVLYNELRAELQHYIVDTVHKVVRQQLHTKMDSGAVAVDSAGGHRGITVSSPLVNTPPFGEKGSINDSGFKTSTSGEVAEAVADVLGSSRAAFDSHVHSVVRAVLSEYSFSLDISEVAERQRLQQRELKALKLECRQRCAALEEELRGVFEGTQSSRHRSGERRTSESPGTESERQVPVTFPRHQNEKSHQHQGNLQMDPEKLVLDVVMRRIDRVTSAYEERCLQRVNLEAVRPLVDHVRRLMSAHQSMIDTVVESRCEQLDGRFGGLLRQQQVHLKELRQKIGGLRADVRSALKDLSEKLNVACPGL